jgi:hypothetical protein
VFTVNGIIHIALLAECGTFRRPRSINMAPLRGEKQNAFFRQTPERAVAYFRLNSANQFWTTFKTRLWV